MSEWDAHDPSKKRQQLLQNAAATEKLVTAERALIAACRKNPIDHAALHAALQADASPDRIVTNGFPALHVAIHLRDVKAMELLLRFGARTDDVNGEYYNALDEAYRANFPEGIKALKRYDAKLYKLAEDYNSFGDDYAQADDYFAPSYQTRANAHLFNMLKNGTAEQVRQALDLGADANAEDRNCFPAFTPVQIAASWVDLDKLKALGAHGADMNKLSTHGQDVIDSLWTAGKKALTPEWVAVFDYVQSKGYSNFFQRHPNDLTFDDLMEPVMTKGKDKPTRLHYLVAHGHVDKVMEILERSEGKRLTAPELLRQEPYYRNETLLKAIASQNQLSRIFTAAVWQGRVEEMMSLQPAVERDVQMKNQIDFDKARSEVMGQRLRDLKSRAVNLKPK